MTQSNLVTATEELVKVFMMREATLETLEQINRDYGKHKQEFIKQYGAANNNVLPEQLVIEASPGNWLLVLFDVNEGAITDIFRIPGIIAALPSAEESPQIELAKRLKERLDTLSTKQGFEFRD